MERPAAKGTVTDLSSVFPADEAQRASKRVQETFAEHQKELDELRNFIGENTALINLVQKLPHELHHDIMVPFGKAAFFPGRLFHTNEFMVLLGEGYYAERTAKQTVDILKRRGKTLESQVESLKAVMQDLKAEASFFDSTAAEVAEGLVEIREEYSEGDSAKKVPNADSMRTVVEEDEYARMMRRFDELEKEELAAENMNESDGDEEHNHIISKVDELEEEEQPLGNASKEGEEVHIDAYFGHNRSQHSPDQKDKAPEVDLLSDESKQLKEGNIVSKELQSKLIFRQDLRNQILVDNTPVQFVSEGNSSSGQGFQAAKSSFEGTEFASPGVKESALLELQPRNEVHAFTGSIVEHTHNLSKQDDSSSKSSAQPTTSKPVSRFKMQRR